MTLKWKLCVVSKNTVLSIEGGGLKADDSGETERTDHTERHHHVEAGEDGGK
ncbi:MAG TPA: hypothetical protein VMV19_18385 [Xanthobacteraceae bacterium]|nr:hypothetical protein [Xanthobacteraceae bacterium]